MIVSLDIQLIMKQRARPNVSMAMYMWYLALLAPFSADERMGRVRLFRFAVFLFSQHIEFNRDLTSSSRIWCFGNHTSRAVVKATSAILPATRQGLTAKTNRVHVNRSSEAMRRSYQMRIRVEESSVRTQGGIENIRS